MGAAAALVAGAVMAKPHSRPFAKAEAPRPSASEAKVENQRYDTFKARMERIGAAATRAGHADLADELEDLTQRVLDREITLDEGLEELRDYEERIRAVIRRR